MTLAEAVALAAQLYEAGRLPEAEGLYRQIDRALPDEPDVLHVLGVIAHRLGRPEEAVTRLHRAIALDAGQAAHHAALGVALKALGRLDERIAAYGAAVRLDPGDARSWSNLGAALNEAARADEAAAACRQALMLNPADAEALTNLGNAQRDRGWPGRARISFERALALDPGLAAARLNRGLLRLAGGDLVGGWADYEDRFAADPAALPRRVPVPAWAGDDLSGKTVLVWREQGLGDELMFGSCYADLIARAGHVIIECDPRLTALFARSFPTATVRRADIAAAVGSADRHIPAGSLPRWLRPDLEAFPAHAGGYLIPDPERVALWRGRLAALGDGPKIGIGWRSGVRSADRSAAYADLDRWGPVLTVPGVRFVNLQYDRCEEEITAAERRFDVSIARWPDLDLRNDLEGAAALTAALDLVITAPTAVGEMAGALGVPVWRITWAGDWSALGTDRRPWFPSMRLFPAGAGVSLDERLAEAGRALAATGKICPAGPGKIAAPAGPAGPSSRSGG